MNEQTRTLLDMIEKLESRVNAYWNFFSVVALAVSGWLITSKATLTTTQGIVLAIAVVIFFGANLSVVRAATARLLAFEAELNAVAPAATFGSDALAPQSVTAGHTGPAGRERCPSSRGRHRRPLPDLEQGRGGLTERPAPSTKALFKTQRLTRARTRE